MSNLFSVFDPSRVFNLSLNWVILFTPLFLPLINFWVDFTQVFYVLSKTARYLNLEFRRILNVNSVPGTTFIFIGTFAFIWINNSLGLFPYIFTPTRHLVVTIGLAIPLWLGPLILRFTKQPKIILSHLVPLGSPIFLAPFIVVIELTRLLIRPITLCVRLAANLVAGHLLLTLMSSPITNASVMLVATILRFMLILVVLELAVASIQAYVFSLLPTLYTEEVNTHKINLRS